MSNYFSVDFDIGFGTKNPSAIAAVESGNIPRCLSGKSDLGKPSVMVDPVWGHDTQSNPIPAVLINADIGYHGALWVSSADFYELAAWLDEFFTLVDTRAHSTHWREQRGAYSRRAVTITEYTPDQISMLAQRERLWSTLDPFISSESMRNSGYSA